MRATVSRTLAGVDAAEWDALIPRDDPHLRYGFLKAVEESGQGREPRYVQVFRAGTGELVAVAAAYGSPVDLLTLVPARWARPFAALRRVAPKLLFLGSLTCGPAVTNCHPNLYVSPDLPDAESAAAAGLLIDTLENLPGVGPILLFFEFDAAHAEQFEAPMTARGYIMAPSLPGTLLDIRWRSLPEYIGMLRKAFRRTVVKDREKAGNLEFEIVDDFSQYADEVWQLYHNVLARAENVFERLTPEFFRALAGFEQSRIVLARDRESRRIVGMELLLCGDSVVQDLYTGIDYTYDADARLYFNLVYPVIGFAGEKGYRCLSLGQTSYDFKARIGATPYPTFLFVRHRNALIHKLLLPFKSALFPATPTVTRHVFREPSEAENG